MAKLLISSMVDIYGCNKRGPPGPPGETGPPGKKGKDAFDLYKWCPVSMLRIFRENEACRFYFKTEDDGILKKEGKPIGLRDHLGKRNAICLQNFEKPVPIYDVYAIPLRGALYEIKNIPLAVTPPTITLIALSFKVLPGVNNGRIFSNKSNTRGVTISDQSTSITFIGTSIQLKYNRKAWNTLIIQFSYISENKTKCIYSLNGEKGTFNQKVHTFERDWTLHIGETRPCPNVLMGSFEVYCKMYPNDADKSYLVPDQIIHLIDEDMRRPLDSPLRYEKEQWIHEEI